MANIVSIMHVPPEAIIISAVFDGSCLRAAIHTNNYARSWFTPQPGIITRAIAIALDFEWMCAYINKMRAACGRLAEQCEFTTSRNTFTFCEEIVKITDGADIVVIKKATMRSLLEKICSVVLILNKDILITDEPIGR